MYAHVKPFEHWLEVVQSDPTGPPPARMQLTDPFVLFVTSHVSFAAQPHCGSRPHVFEGGVVVHVPPLEDPPLEDEVDPPLEDEDDDDDDDVEPPLEDDVDPPVDDDDDDVEPPLEVEPPLDVEPPLLVDDSPLEDSPLDDSPLEDSPLEPPLDVLGGGTVSLSGSGSVGAFDFAGVIPPLTSGVVFPSAQATTPSIASVAAPA